MVGDARCTRHGGLNVVLRLGLEDTTTEFCEQNRIGNRIWSGFSSAGKLEYVFKAMAPEAL